MVDELNQYQQYSWLETALNYLSSVFKSQPDENALPQYPRKSNRYFSLGWNQKYQYCYSDEDLRILQRIQTKFNNLLPDKESKYFELREEKHWYDWWTCKSPIRNPISPGYETDSFTLQNREAKDSTSYPLWNFADNMARQIANWQGQRVKDQNLDLMNDPVMLVLDELKDWFFYILTEKDARKEILDYIAKRQSYIKNIIHSIPNFGPDRVYLQKIHDKLDEATKIILNYMANKELPELLSDIIIKGKSLETTIGTYLHFLLINEEVADNFSDDFLEGAKENCHLSPVCKVNANANQNSNTRDIDGRLVKYQQVNKFFQFDKIFENDGQLNVQIKLKDSLLNKIKFANFVTKKDKENYLQAIAALESLISIRKTLEQFKNVQSSLGTYIFAVNYLDKTNSLAANYIELIDKSQSLIEEILKSANQGFNEILKHTPNDINQYKNFEKNLRALDTRFALDTTATKQLETYCVKARESMITYQEMMKKLVTRLNSGEASHEIQLAMQKLILQINYINTFLPAQLREEPFIVDKKAEVEALTQCSPAINHIQNKENEDISFFEEKQFSDIQPKFDLGKWDNDIKYDKTTGKPIFTYRVFKNDTEVGTAEFFNQPFLCFSKDKKQHNIIKRTGVLNAAEILDQLSIDAICQAFPPTLWDKVIISARDAAVHGFFRGGADVVAMTLKSQGVSDRVANYINRFMYYGCVFGMNFNIYFQRIQDEEMTSRCLNAMYQAALDTGRLYLINISLNTISDLLNKASQYLERDHCSTLGWCLKKLGALTNFGMFAYNAVENGVVETSAALVSGSVAQEVTERAGNYLIKK